jgi:hypothetical protein
MPVTSIFPWLNLVSLGQKVSKARRVSRREHGFLIRFSEDLTGLSFNEVDRGYREVRILLDHAETMLEYKMEFKNLDQFINTDRNYEHILAATDLSVLDEDEHKDRKKTKRALAQTVTSFKRQAEVVESKIHYLLHIGLSVAQTEKSRWPLIRYAQSDSIADRRNKGTHSYRCVQDTGHRHFNPNSYWAKLWSRMECVHAQIQDLEECLWRTKLKLQGQTIYVPPRPPPTAPKQFAIPQHISPLSSRIRHYSRICLMYLVARVFHPTFDWLARKTDVWVPQETSGFSNSWSTTTTANSSTSSVPN